tara:strand:- start:1500 stop:2483 length:984 start_codon:yes stop_codon:yes gene_type:complete
METINIELTEEDLGQRLDKALTRHLPDLSRARLQDLMASGNVTDKDGQIPQPKTKVKSLSQYTVTVPPAVDPDPVGQALPIEIVYEDEHLIVLNKAPDMVVHPAIGHTDGTLVNALIHHCGDELSGIGGVKRPGIVHRLDKETSGLMLVAKHDKAHQHLSKQLSRRTLSRVYHCFVWGLLSPRSGKIKTLLGRDSRDRKKRAVVTSGGKDAVTNYRMLKQYGTLASKVECRLESGRTHQIRVHMGHIKHWLIGDPAYGRPHLAKFLRGRIHLTRELADTLSAFPRQALHAAEIGFVHPETGEEMQFQAGYPEDMIALEKDLERLNVK